MQPCGYSNYPSPHSSGRRAKQVCGGEEEGGRNVQMTNLWDSGSARWFTSVSDKDTFVWLWRWSWGFYTCCNILAWTAASVDKRRKCEYSKTDFYLQCLKTPFVFPAVCASCVLSRLLLHSCFIMKCLSVSSLLWKWSKSFWPFTAYCSLNNSRERGMNTSSKPRTDYITSYVLVSGSSSLFWYLKPNQDFNYDI